MASARRSGHPVQVEQVTCYSHFRSLPCPFDSSLAKAYVSRELTLFQQQPLPLLRLWYGTATKCQQSAIILLHGSPNRRHSVQRDIPSNQEKTRLSIGNVRSGGKCKYIKRVVCNCDMGSRSGWVCSGGRYST